MFTFFLSFSNFDRVRWMSPVIYFHFPVDQISISFYTFAVLCCLLYFYVNRYYSRNYTQCFILHRAVGLYYSIVN